MENRGLIPIPLSEAARLLAVSPRTVRRLIEDGKLTAVRIGPTLVLPADALPMPLNSSGDGADNQPLLTLHEVAARLCCSPREVRNLSERGTLKPVSIGRSQRWLPDEVEGFVRRGGVHGG